MAADIVIVDYGRGNLRSVQKALDSLGARARISSDPADLEADGMILPGVGAFRDAMDRLRESGLIDPVKAHIAAGKQFLGVCLGLHLLFTEGEEFGHHAGLDIIPGRVIKFAEGKKIPHMGWNTLQIVKPGGILAGIPDGAWVYFVHSYYPVPAEEAWTAATTEYGETFASVVSRGHVHATQFHPEKSQSLGLRILGNFVALVDRGRV